MRMRKKPWAEQALRDHPHIVPPEPQQWKGKWHDFFEQQGPIHMEIGTGKGQFITQMAEKNPDILFIGVEVQESVLAMALRGVQKVREDKGLTNIALVGENARHLESFLETGEISRIYLNFSDPWPKRRHAKRRLTHRSILEMYSRVLCPAGEIHLKTDNEGLFEYSLNTFSAYGCRLRNITFDLHDIRKQMYIDESEAGREGKLPTGGEEIWQDGGEDRFPRYAEGHALTEYEQKFTGQGKRIYRCEAVLPAKA
jgi:tRNA (guanine-N7-)-methyltransferase